MVIELNSDAGKLVRSLAVTIRQLGRCPERKKNVSILTKYFIGDISNAEREIGLSLTVFTWRSLWAGKTGLRTYSFLHSVSRLSNFHYFFSKELWDHIFFYWLLNKLHTCAHVFFHGLCCINY